MNLNTKKQSLEQGTFILLFASIIVKIIGALFKIILSSNFALGDLGFGFFSAAHDFVAPLHTLAISGFPVAIAKVIADYSANGKDDEVANIFKISRNLLAIISLVLVLVFLAVAYFGLGIERNSSDFSSYLIAIPSSFFCILASSYKGVFEGKQQMTPVAISNIIEAACKLIIGLTLAIVAIKITSNAGFAAAVAMLGVLTGSVFSLLYLHFSHKKSRLFSKQINKRDRQYNNAILKTIVIISIPMILSSLSGSIVAFIDAITVRPQIADLIHQNNNQMLEKFSDIILEIKNSTGNVTIDDISTVLYGIRSKGYTMFNLVCMLTVSVGVGATPAITESFATGNADKLKENIVSVLKISSIIAFPAGIGYLCFGGRIISLMYGNSASSVLCGKLLSLYGIAAIFVGLTIPLGNILIAINSRKAVIINITVGVLFKLLLNLTLTPLPSVHIYGSVISTLVCYLIICILHFVVLMKKSDLKGEFKNTLLKPFLAAVICGISALAVGKIGDSNLITILSMAIACIIFVALVIIFKTFSYYETLKLPLGERVLSVVKRLKKQK